MTDDLFTILSPVILVVDRIQGAAKSVVDDSEPDYFWVPSIPKVISPGGHRMALGKQAKVLSKGQIDGTLGYIAKTRHPVRNRVIFLLSAKAGLRAKEIASLTWDMVTEADGEIGRAINLRNEASKGRSGRIIPLNVELRQALIEWRGEAQMKRASSYVVVTERSAKTSAHAVVLMFAKWYRVLGLSGCSSHSGRRTFITNAARKISTVGGSLRDVQILAGHSALGTTQRYIEADAAAQRKIVDLV